MSVPEVRDGNDIDPNDRRAPSVASAQRDVVAVQPPPVVTTPSAVDPESRLLAEISRLESRLEIANAAHIELLQEVTSLRRRVDDALMRDVSGDIRFLRQDVNSILESLGVPGTFIQEYRSFVDQIRGTTDRLHVRIRDVEEIIRMDGDDNARRSVSVVSEADGAGSAKQTRRKKSVRIHSDSSDSGSSQDSHSDSSGSSDSEDERRKSRATRSRATYTTQGAIRTRSKGMRHLGLKELKPTNPLYRKLLSYRYYRLQRSSGNRSSRGTGRVKEYIKRMSISLWKREFDGRDPIQVLDFLARFVQEADILGMNEAQAYLALPYFLRGSAEEQFMSVRGTSGAAEGGVTCWPEAVQYLLRSYATGSAIQEAVLALRDTKQRPNETETEYSTRLNKAFHRCGNVFPFEERCTMFVDGLDPSIRALVARHREENRRISYLELVHYSQAEGDTYRARNGNRKRSSQALLADASDSSLSVLRRNSDKPENDHIHFLGSNPDSLPTSDLPSTSVPTTDEDPTLYAHGVRVPAAPLAHANNGSRFSRPGWRDTNPRRVDSHQHDNQALVICYLCYHFGHKAPDCTLPLREGAKIIAQYESLSAAQKALVPSNSYEEQKLLRSYLHGKVQGNVPVAGNQLGSHEVGSAPNPVEPASKN